MTWLFALLLSLAVAAPKTSQKSFESSAQGADTVFEVAWKDGQGKRQKIDFALPTAVVDNDKDEVTWLQRKKMYESVAKDVRSFAKKQKKKGVTMKVTVERGVLISASGPKKETKAALKEAEAIRDESMQKWLYANFFTELDSGDVSFDHARLAAEYADDLAPLAAALRDGTRTNREYVERTLSFVQSIPYEARKRNGGDPGYRRPVALLSRNKGDCDSKAVLFLALVHAELPKVDKAVIYIPGHALAAVELPAEKGDKVRKVDGEKLIYAESVGPALHPLGTAAPENAKQAKKGEARLVPR